MSIGSRVKDAWKVLRGENAVPVFNHPYRIVQLIPFQDSLLGLDGEGKLWKLNWTAGWEKILYVEMVSDNPVRRW